MSQPEALAQEAAPTLAPTGIRVASTLCWVVGVLTILAALAVGIPAYTQQGTIVPLAPTAVAGIGVCVAAVLVRRQRKLGVLFLVLAWAVPTAVNVLNHQSVRGNFLLFAALLLALANWKNLH
jgi:hypothetical protein